MERSGNFYKAIRLGYILISILIGCMAYNRLMRLTERRKMEVNENRGRLCRKKLQGKIRKKKNHQKEKDITGSVKRANHNKGSMIVSDPTELVQPGGNNHSSRFVRLCVGACFIHGAG